MVRITMEESGIELDNLISDSSTGLRPRDMNIDARHIAPTCGKHYPAARLLL